MKKQLTYVIFISLFVHSCVTHAQKESIEGLWEIQKVQVGSKQMTPVAKWTRINNDGTYQSGNGWLQSANGKWNFDKKSMTFSAADPLDIADEFGGFKVSFEQEKMIWERKEEGMSVKVTLKTIENLPMSPADYLEGLWDLVEITENGISILKDFDKNNKHRLQIRWDRLYINHSPEGNKLSGYWHINGHKPEITLLPHQEGKSAESWRVEVNEKELIMTGVSDQNRSIQRRYVRQNSF